MKPITPSGTLIQKIHCQPQCSVMKPPRGGPSTGAVSAGQVSMAMARIKPSFGVPLSTATRPTGTIIAPPIPCSIRAPVNSQSPELRLQSAEASVNTNTAPPKTRRGPNRSDIQPLRGMKTAMASI